MKTGNNGRKTAEHDDAVPNGQQSEMITNEVSLLISAEQGKGVNTAGDMIGSASARMGLYIFQNIEYHSNIMGKNSYYRIVLSEKAKHSHHDQYDVAILLGGDAMTHVLDKVRPDGAVIYNTEDVKKNFSSAEDVEKAMAEIESGKFKAFGIPASTAIKRMPKAQDIKPKVLAKMVNTMLVGATYAVLGSDIETVDTVIDNYFSNKPNVIPLNQAAARVGFDYIKENFDSDFNMKIEDISDKIPASEERYLMKGTNAVALGAINAGMQLYVHYPITPASDTGDLLDAWKEEAKIIVEQAEDEIAAMNAVVGGGRTGVRSMTGTSGPGFNLKTEALGMATMNEDPCVIMLAQRPGPSTGLPTRGDQSDLMLALYAGHGGAERIVLMPGDLDDQFYMVQEAFNLADHYQMPVIFTTDKTIMNSTETIPPFNLDRIPIDRGSLLTQADFNTNGYSKEKYARYKFTDSGISPRSVPGTSGGEYNSSTDEHTEYGIITDNADNRLKFMDKRLRKMKQIAADIPEEDRVELFGEKDADYSIIAWGSTKGAIIDGMELLKEQGYSVNYLQIKYASPFPTKYVKDFMTNAKCTVLVEENRLSLGLEDGTVGQRGMMETVIKSLTGLSFDKRILKLNTRPFSMEEINDYMIELTDADGRNTVYGDRV